MSEIRNEEIKHEDDNQHVESLPNRIPNTPPMAIYDNGGAGSVKRELDEINSDFRAG